MLDGDAVGDQREVRTEQRPSSRPEFENALFDEAHHCQAGQTLYAAGDPELRFDRIRDSVRPIGVAVRPGQQDLFATVDTDHARERIVSRRLVDPLRQRVHHVETTHRRRSLSAHLRRPLPPSDLRRSEQRAPTGGVQVEVEPLPRDQRVVGIPMWLAKISHEQRDLAQVPPDPVHPDRHFVDCNAGSPGIVVGDPRVFFDECPKVSLGRRHQGGIPVDQHYAGGGVDGVATVRLAMGEHQAPRMSRNLKDEFVVSSEEPSDRIDVAVQQVSRSSRVGPRTPGHVAIHQGDRKLVTARDRKVVVHRGVSDGGVDSVDGDDQIERAEAVNPCWIRSPRMRLAIDVRVQREAVSVVDRMQAAPGEGACRCNNEVEPRIAHEEVGGNEDVAPG